MLTANLIELRYINPIFNSFRPDIIFFANGGFVQVLNVANETSVSILINSVVVEEFVMLYRDYREFTLSHTSTLEAIKQGRTKALENSEPLPMIYGVEGQFLTMEDNAYYFDQFDFKPIKYTMRYMKVKDIAPELSIRLGDIKGEIMVKRVPYYVMSREDILFIYDIFRRDGTRVGENASKKDCHVLIGKERVEVVIEGIREREGCLVYGSKRLTPPSYAHSDKVGFFKLNYATVRALKLLADRKMIHGAAFAKSADKLLIEGYDKKGFLTLKMFG